MLHMLFLILKIIGSIVLVILGLILLLLSLILLVSVRYAISFEKETAIQAKGTVRWLWGLISVSVSYRNETPVLDIRILGHSLNTSKKRNKREKDIDCQETNQMEAAEPISFQSPTEPQPPDLTADVGNQAEDEEETTSLENPCSSYEPKETPSSKKSRKNRDSDNRHSKEVPKENRLSQKAEQVVHTWSSIKNRLKEGCSTLEKGKMFWQEAGTQAAKTHLLKEGNYLLHHFFPKKLYGWLHFGFEDPAITGQVLGIVYIAVVLSEFQLDVNGNFEQHILQGNITMQGHIRLCHILKSAAGLWMDPNIRKIFQRIRTHTAE